MIIHIYFNYAYKTCQIRPHIPLPHAAQELEQSDLCSTTWKFQKAQPKPYVFPGTGKKHPKFIWLTKVNIILLTRQQYLHSIKSINFAKGGVLSCSGYCFPAIVKISLQFLGAFPIFRAFSPKSVKLFQAPYTRACEFRIFSPVHTSQSIRLFSASRGSPAGACIRKPVY